MDVNEQSESLTVVSLYLPAGCLPLYTHPYCMWNVMVDCTSTCIWPLCTGPHVLMRVIHSAATCDIICFVNSMLHELKLFAYLRLLNWLLFAGNCSVEKGCQFGLYCGTVCTLANKV